MSKRAVRPRRRLGLDKARPRARRLRPAPRSPVGAQLGSGWEASVSLGRAQDSTTCRRFLVLVLGIQCFECGECVVSVVTWLCRRWRRNTTDGISERQRQSHNQGRTASGEAVLPQCVHGSLPLFARDIAIRPRGLRRGREARREADVQVPKEVLTSFWDRRTMVVRPTSAGGSGGTRPSLTASLHKLGALGGGAAAVTALGRAALWLRLSLRWPLRSGVQVPPHLLCPARRPRSTRPNSCWSE
jgi:hypothetical protein